MEGPNQFIETKFGDTYEISALPPLKMDWCNLQEAQSMHV